MSYIIIEPMRLEDIPRVMAIEHESFSMRWSEQSYRREILENKMAHYITIRLDENSDGSSDRGPIIGYAGMWVMLDEAHITAIAIVPEHRGMGLGEVLLMTMFDLARQIGAEFVTLEVRSSNSIAQNLYRKYGMVEAGVRKGYYTVEREDAIIMTSENILTREFTRKLETLEDERLAELGKPVRKIGLSQSVSSSSS